MKYISLEGTWQVRMPDGLCFQMYLPGTLDENGIGYPDRGSAQVHPAENAENDLCDDEPQCGDSGLDESASISTRFTRKYTFEGEADQKSYFPGNTRETCVSGSGAGTSPSAFYRWSGNPPLPPAIDQHAAGV